MRNQGFFFAIIGCVQILFGIYLVASNIRLIPIANKSVNWSSTNGQITHSQIVIRTLGDYDAEVFCGPEVRYSYRVQGQALTADRISFNSSESCSETEAEQYDPRYAVGRQVIVYYDPERPSSAVLEPGSCVDCYLNLISGVVFAVIGFVVLRKGWSTSE